MQQHSHTHIFHTQTTPWWALTLRVMSLISQSKCLNYWTGSGTVSYSYVTYDKIAHKRIKESIMLEGIHKGHIVFKMMWLIVGKLTYLLWIFIHHSLVYKFHQQYILSLANVGMSADQKHRPLPANTGITKEFNISCKEGFPVFFTLFKMVLCPKVRP